MSLQNVSNHKQLLIGKNNPTSPTAGTVATPSSLADGAIAVTTIDGVILDTTSSAALSDTAQVIFVQGQGSTKPLIKTAPFAKKDVIVAKGKLYAAAAQQVSTVGYDGSTGNIVNPGVGTSIILRNTFKTNFYQFSDKLMESIVGYKVTAADTIASLATKLQKRAIQDVQKYVNIPYKVELLSSNAGVANAATAGADFTHLKFTKGSTLVVGTNGSGVEMNGSDEAIDVLAAGYFLRAGTAVTSPTYLVNTVTSGTGTTPAGTPLRITLDSPFQGDTTEIAVGSTEYITAANVVAGNVGIKFTGLPQRLFGANTFRYETSKFVTTAQNFSTTEVVNAATVPTEGSGVYEQIAEEEFFFQLGEGMHDNALIQIPPVTMRTNVETTGTYSILDFEVNTQSGTMSFINNPIARKQIRLAINSATRADQLDEVADIVDAWLGTTLL